MTIHSTPLRLRWLPLLLALQLAVAPAPVRAGVPQNVPGLEDTRGELCITTTPDGGTLIVQKSPDAQAIWTELPQSLDIRQPNASSRLLNEIHSESGTFFNGQLTANGIVYLTDVLGITIGPEARIEAARFLAAGGLLTWQDFLEGEDHFRLTAPVEHYGLIQADSVALAGTSVASHGDILSRDTVVMVAGDEAWIREHGSPVVVKLDLPESEADAPPEVPDAGGLGVGDPLAYAIRQSGEVRARTIALDSVGVTEVRGTLDASSATPGETGGEIAILGEAVHLAGARVDASGPAGGGRVRIGGDLQGQGEARNARVTVLDAESEVRADALDGGDGGTLIVWSDDTTLTRAALSARGGENGGDGGFAEVSGKRTLDVAGFPDVSAPAGDGGSLLFDPTNITIVRDVDPNDLTNPSQDLDSAFDRLLDPDFVASNPGAEIRANTDDSQISSSEIEKALRLGVDIRIVTDTFGTVEGDQEGNITFASDAYMQFTDDPASPIEVGTEALLELSAANDIVIEQQQRRPDDMTSPPVPDAIRNDSENLTLSLVFTANDANRTESDTAIDPGDDNRNVGDLEVYGGLATGGGDIALNGFNVTLDAPIDTGGGGLDVNADPNQVPGGYVRVTPNAPITTLGGDVLVFAQSIQLLTEDDDGLPRISSSLLSVQAPIDTRPVDPEATGGSVSIVGSGSPVFVEASIESGGGDIALSSLPRLFQTEDPDDPDGDPLTLPRGGLLLALAELESGGGSITIAGNEVVVDGDVTSEGGDIFFDDANDLRFEPDSDDVDDCAVQDFATCFRLDADVTSAGGDITFGDFVNGVGRLELGVFEGITIDAGDGSITVNGRNEVVAAQATTLRGSSALVGAGADGSGDLLLTASGTRIEADLITLAAGDGITLPTPPSDDPDAPEPPPNDDAVIELAPDIALRDLTGTMAPERFLFVQDAGIADDDVLPLSVFGGAAPQTYRIESSDHGVMLGAAGTSRLVGTDLTIAFRTGVSLAGLAADTLALRAYESLTVDATLAQEVSGLESLSISSGEYAQVQIGPDDDPEQVEVPGDLVIEPGASLTVQPGGTLALHAGRNGFGNLVVGAEGSTAVALEASELTLRAGDGSTFDDISLTEEQLEGKRNAAITIAPETQLTVLDDQGGPGRFELRQDASITDATLPAASQLGGVAGLDYGIRSDDGSITLFETDDLAVRGSQLSLAALDGIQLLSDIGVETLDIGGIADFVVTSELIDRITLTGAESKLVLRAGLSPQVEGDLSFEPGIIVAADELRLIAGPSDPALGATAARSSNVDLSNDPQFVGADGTGTPDRFLLRQASGFSDANLPSASDFPNAGDPMTVAIRSDNGDIDISSPDLGIANTDVIFSAVQVFVGTDSPSSDDPVLDIAGTYRTNRLSAFYILTDPPDGATPSGVIDASGISLRGFDSGFDEADGSAEFDFDLPFDEQSPAQFLLLQQDGSFSAQDLLPAQTLAETQVEIRSTSGDIDLRAQPQDAGTDVLTGSRLVLVLGDPELGTEDGTIYFPALLDLESLEISTRGGLVVGTGNPTTLLSAREAILMDIGQTGQLEPDPDVPMPPSPANLEFEGDVLLRANRISLSAGDGFNSQDYPEDDPDSWPTEVPSIDVTNARFEFTDGLPAMPEPEDEAREPSFAFVQDAAIQQGDLPSGSAFTFSGPFDALETYTVVSLEGQVEEDAEAGTVTPRGTIEFTDYMATQDDFQTHAFQLGANQVVIATPGELRFDIDDPVLDIGADQIRFVADEFTAPTGAAAENLVLSGFASAPTSPGFFFLEQTQQIGVDNLPGRDRFVGGTTGLNYVLVSDAGIDVEGADFADRVLNSDLLLSAENGNVRIAEDLLLNSLTVLASDQIQLATETIATNGREFGFDEGRARDQRYLAPVLLEQDLTLTGVGFEFGSTVDGPSALTIDADEQIAFRGDVGATTAVRLLDAETLGDRSTGALADDPSDDTLFTIEFGGTLDDTDFFNLDLADISGNMLPAQVAAPSITVRAAGELALNRGPEGADGLFEGVRDEVPEAATITQPGGDLTLISVSGNFDVGPLEKVTTTGDLTISAAGRARFADLTARNLRITAPRIQVMRRPAGNVLQADGTLLRDAGVDLLANTIELNGAPSALSAGKNPVFGVQDPRFISTSVIAFGLFPVAAINPDSSPLVPGDVLDARGRVLDLLPLGPSRADLSGALPVLALPGPLVPGPVRHRIVNRRLLPLVGVDPRLETRVEYGRRLAGAGVYDDVGEVQPFAHLSTLRVVEARLRPGEAQRAVGLYEEVFGPDTERTAEVRAVLQRVVDDYRTTTGARKVVGFELRRFVRNRPSTQFEAYELLEKLDALFRHHRRLGLTPGEYSVIQRRWLERIAPTGISLDELAETIHPSRYVRGSDILDIFGD